MRTSHREINRRIADVKSKLTDEQIFGSASFGSYLTDIAEVCANRYKKKLIVKMFWDENPDASIAFTDNKNISINAANFITKSFPTRMLKADSLMGLNGHEIGHVLYTDFSTSTHFQNAIKAGKFYPNFPTDLDETEDENLEEIKEELLNNNIAKKVIMTTIHSLNNILEDVYVEARMCESFPGRFKRGITLNNIRFSEIVPTIKTQIDAGSAKFSIIQNLMIQYCISGDINNVDEYSGEYLDFVNDIIPLIDDCVYDDDCRTRYIASNIILVKAWQYIKVIIENTKDKIEEEQAKSPNKSVEELLDKILAKLSEEVVSKGDDPVGTGKGNHTSGTFLHTKDDEYTDEIEEVLASETARIELEKTVVSPATTSGSVTKNSAYLGSGYGNTEKDMERLFNRIATDIANESIEQELSEELQEEVSKIEYGNIHKGVNMRIHRMSYVDPMYKEMYNKVSVPLLPISKRMQKQVLQALKNEKAGERQNNLIIGRRLNPRAFVNNDGRVFYNNKLPVDSTDLVVSLLIDESGSMCGSDRITSARATAIVVYDFCKSLNIPIMITGHTASSGVHLYNYAEFESVDNNDKFRILDMTARWSNRDGAALRYVCERLNKRSEKTKLLIVISDGQPADTDYYGTGAEADLRGIKREYSNKGITMFAAAIGNDKKNIERIYGDGFLDITDLNKLPTNLTKLIVRYIKK